MATSARPEVRRTADGGAYSPFRSILLVLTHDYIITHVFGLTGSDGHERLNDADAGCALADDRQGIAILDRVTFSETLALRLKLFETNRAALR